MIKFVSHFLVLIKTSMNFVKIQYEVNEADLNSIQMQNNLFECENKKKDEAFGMG